MPYFFNIGYANIANLDFGELRKPFGACTRTSYLAMLERSEGGARFLSPLNNKKR